MAKKNRELETKWEKVVLTEKRRQSFLLELASCQSFITLLKDQEERYTKRSEIPHQLDRDLKIMEGRIAVINEALENGYEFQSQGQINVEREEKNFFQGRERLSLDRCHATLPFNWEF